jgi:signal transduction histidine kinase
MIKAQPNFWGYSIGVTAIVLTLLLQFPGFLQSLFVANGFIPHGHCYLWKPGLVWLHVVSDTLIASAYVGISATLAYLVYRTRQEIPFHWMFLAFGLFIVACGSTHFMEVWTLWHPTYWLSGALKVITASASVATALVLPTLVPRALALLETAKLSQEHRSHLETANQELAALNSKLKELDQLKTQFFANVSHELRTPLALILGPTERLLADPTFAQEQHYSLEVIDRNARLLLKQVNDLLDVAKLEAGKPEMHCAEVDLAQLVSVTAANFEALAQERRIAFAVETPEPVLAQLDATKVQRILLNLLSNAFKFTPDGGSIRCVLSSLDAVSPDDVRSPHAVIGVEDSGPGVPVELRDAIFERFRQGEGSATRRFGGTGLGLAIVKEFVELQGGSVTVDAAPAGGARFTVKLPLVASSATVAAQTAPSAVAASTAAIESDTMALDAKELSRPLLEELRTLTEIPAIEQAQAPDKPLVLVVEDNAEMRQFITASLAPDYRTASAQDGEDGLEQAIDLQPDLILTDIMMPQLSGNQLLQRLRTHPELDATPVIMLTAKVDDALRIQLLQQGAQDYLMKPFAVGELRARVGNLIAIKRTRDFLQQELASQNHDLEALAQEVSLRRRELQIAYEALQHQAEDLAQANRMKDEFLAIVSHELRTPLNAILGWAQTLRVRRFDQATTSRALETIERNARLQARLIEDLLDLSRLLRGKLLLDMRPVDLNSIAQAALQTVQLEAERKGVQLQSNLCDVNCSVCGDAGRLQQVLQNLLTNAVKFTPRNGQVKVHLECQDQQVRIQVIDTGEGIKPEFLPHIFDYFSQQDSSTTRKHGGLGLGLAIVRQLVELHHGHIEAESLGENQGATFTITLPLVVNSAPPRYLC